jgi:hypothetical protein
VLLIGKLLETLGAGLIAWVGMRAMYIAVWIEGPVRSISPEEGSVDIEPPSISDAQKLSDVQKLLLEIQRINEKKNKLFGYYEAIYVGTGTLLIALGCLVYFIGLIMET